MGTVALVAAAILAGLICPAIMWWQHRRGRDATCCPPVGRGQDDLEELKELQREHADLLSRVASLHHQAVPSHPAGLPISRARNGSGCHRRYR